MFEERTFEEYFNDFYDIKGVEDIFAKRIFNFIEDEVVATFVGYLVDGDVASLKTVIGDIYVADVVDILVKVEGSEGAWKVGKVENKDYLNTLLDVQVSDILGWIESKQVKEAVNGVFGTRTFGVYFDDFNAKVFEESIFDCIEDEEVATVIGYIIDKKWSELKAIA